MDDSLDLSAEYRVVVEEINNNSRYVISRAVTESNNQISLIVSTPCGKTPAALWSDFAAYSGALERDVVVCRDGNWANAEPVLSENFRSALCAAEVLCNSGWLADPNNCSFRVGYDLVREFYTIYSVCDLPLNKGSSLETAVCCGETAEAFAKQWIAYRAAFLEPVLHVRSNPLSTFAELCAVTDEHLEIEFEFNFC